MQVYSHDLECVSVCVYIYIYMYIYMYIYIYIYIYIWLLPSVIAVAVTQYHHALSLLLSHRHRLTTRVIYVYHLKQYQWIQSFCQRKSTSVNNQLKQRQWI